MDKRVSRGPLFVASQTVVVWVTRVVVVWVVVVTRVGLVVVVSVGPGAEQVFSAAGSSCPPGAGRASCPAAPSEGRARRRRASPGLARQTALEADGC